MNFINLVKPYSSKVIMAKSSILYLKAQFK